MSHLYLHIPFCRRACTYCDFHFSVDLGYKNKIVESICTEIQIRHGELKQKNLKTIYFGGGTPSLLEKEDFKKIFKTIHHYFTVDALCEITLEANPEDISKEKIEIWREYKINRISLGVQSFHPDEIQFLGRNHNQKQVEFSIDLLQKEKFENISIDLIYGLPMSNLKKWQSNLDFFSQFKIPHLSCYGLTLEKGTKLFYLSLKKQLSSEKIEQRIEEDFYLLHSYMEKKKFLDYEISNFAKEEKHFSRHNLCYWQGREFLGVGPSAHSFNGEEVRTKNTSKNQSYIFTLKNYVAKLSPQNNTFEKKKNSQNLKSQFKFNLDDELEKIETKLFHREKLSEVEIYHDYLISHWRSSLGCNLTEMKQKFSAKIYCHFEKKLQEIDGVYLNKKEDRISLTLKGKLYQNYVLRFFFQDKN